MLSLYNRSEKNAIDTWQKPIGDGELASCRYLARINQTVEWLSQWVTRPIDKEQPTTNTTKEKNKNNQTARQCWKCSQRREEIDQTKTKQRKDKEDGNEKKKKKLTNQKLNEGADDRVFNEQHQEKKTREKKMKKANNMSNCCCVSIAIKIFDMDTQHRFLVFGLSGPVGFTGRLRSSS